MKSILGKKSLLYLLLFFLVVIAAIYRFYDLNWGAPYYFHPDERNIASSVTQLHFPDQLNPHFFAYGSIPIYSVYFTGVTINTFVSSPNPMNVSFEHAILIGRIFSAILSLGTLLLLYKTARLFVSRALSIFAVALGTFSIALIQYAHFGTFEMYLSFFSLLLLYHLLQFAETHKYFYFILAVLTIGVLGALKISSIVLLPLPILIALSIELKTSQFKSRELFEKIKKVILYSALAGILVVGIFILGNPYAILDFTSFSGSIKYESEVATGSLPVFYTQTFTETLPIFFQSLYVMPFLLNPFVWVFTIPSLFFVCIKSLKKKNLHYRVLILFFLFLFIPQAVLFVKWTRYMVPTIPIIYLIIVVTLSHIQNLTKRPVKSLLAKSMYYGSLSILLLSSIIWAVSFVKTVYVAPDTRISAAKKMEQLQYENDRVVSESYDMGIVPFDTAFSTISLFNFYDLENDSALKDNLPSTISQSDLLILPSQRIIKSRVLHPDLFPDGHRFYQSVQTQSQFKQIYSTPCDMWCTILYLGDPIYGVEDTANVFDRPTVNIYKIE